MMKIDAMFDEEDCKIFIAQRHKKEEEEDKRSLRKSKIRRA